MSLGATRTKVAVVAVAVSTSLGAAFSIGLAAFRAGEKVGSMKTAAAYEKEITHQKALALKSGMDLLANDPDSLAYREYSSSHHLYKTMHSSFPDLSVLDQLLYPEIPKPDFSVKMLRDVAAKTAVGEPLTTCKVNDSDAKSPLSDKQG